MNKVAMFLFIACLSGQLSLADETGKKSSSMKMPAMTTEQRQKMAVAHEKMASCLRTEKPLSDCHEEMMKTCKDSMDKGGCAMMGGKEMHGDHTMHHEESDSK